MTDILSSITRKGKALLLAYDQGLEHGPTDFNDENADPSYIVKLADSGYFSGVIFQKGIAEKYYPISEHKTPLIIKLNGRTNLQSGEPYSPLLCSVDQALSLGASAVGYTIYPGSSYQEIMMKVFAEIEESAHKHNIPVILWMYPRGGKVAGKEKSTEVLTYASRIGLELGADLIKIYYPQDPRAFPDMVKMAGKARIVVSGGTKSTDEQLYSMTRRILNEGGAGLAVGRNIWQAENALERAQKLSQLLFSDV